MQTISRTKSQADSKAPVASQDAISLLKADHEAVTGLFADFRSAHSSARKKTIVAKICTALSVHVQIEDEIFYPDVKAAMKDKILIPQATVEHADVNDLVGKLQTSEPDGEMYEAKVKVLSEYFKHHVKEEQNEIFPKVKESSLDLDDLGMRMAARKAELLAARWQ